MAKKRIHISVDEDLLELLQERYGTYFNQSGLIQALLDGAINADEATIKTTNKTIAEKAKIYDRLMASGQLAGTELLADTAIAKADIKENTQIEKTLALDIAEYKKLCNATENPFIAKNKALQLKLAIMEHYNITDDQFSKITDNDQSTGYETVTSIITPCEFENVQDVAHALESKRLLYLQAQNRDDSKAAHLMKIFINEFGKFGINKEQIQKWIETGQIGE